MGLGRRLPRLRDLLCGVDRAQAQPVLPLLYLMVFTQGVLGYGLTSVIGAIVRRYFKAGTTAAFSARSCWRRWRAARSARG